MSDKVKWIAYVPDGTWSRFLDYASDAGIVYHVPPSQNSPTSTRVYIESNLDHYEQADLHGLGVKVCYNTPMAWPRGAAGA